MKYLKVSEMPKEMLNAIKDGFNLDFRGQPVVDDCVSYISNGNDDGRCYVLKNAASKCWFFWVDKNNNLTSRPARGL